MIGLVIFWCSDVVRRGPEQFAGGDSHSSTLRSLQSTDNIKTNEDLLRGTAYGLSRG